MSAGNLLRLATFPRLAASLAYRTRMTPRAGDVDRIHKYKETQNISLAIAGPRETMKGIRESAGTAVGSDEN